MLLMAAGVNDTKKLHFGGARIESLRVARRIPFVVGTPVRGPLPILRIQQQHMVSQLSRREFLRTLAIGAGLSTCGRGRVLAQTPGPEFRISLVERSLNDLLAKKKLAHLDFAKTAHQTFGIDAIEYGSEFFDKARKDDAYLAELNKRAADSGVRQLLIFVVGEGRLADANAQKRADAVRNHSRWVDTAKALGCHSICVDPRGEGAAAEQLQRAAEGLAALLDYSAKHNINILLGNYGGASSEPKWLLELFKKLNAPGCGALPIVGAFAREEVYRAIPELVPRAKGLSATTYDFDAQGNETSLDYPRLMKAALEAGYRGYVGVDYQGKRLDETAGVLATKSLLQRLQKPAA